MWPYVMRQLEKLMQQTNASLSVQYNIARLLEQRKRNRAKKWKLPINLGVETYNNKMLHKWQKNQLRLYDLYEQIFQDPKNSVSELTQRSLVNGRLLSCGNFWAGLVVDDEVKEIWVHRQ